MSRKRSLSQEEKKINDSKKSNLDNENWKKESFENIQPNVVETILVRSATEKCKSTHETSNNSLPDVILQSLKKQSSARRLPVSSMLGQTLRGKFLGFRNCGICEEPKSRKERFNVAKCPKSHKFCESCLHHYAIYKINMFQEVSCPFTGCEKLLDMELPFFATLPINIQKRYRKIHLFSETSKDPTLRLCPINKCQGVIKLNTNGPIACDHCLVIFCAKCFLESHEGACDDKELQFFQNNLKFRRCKRCRVVIEKTHGCNHMTCRCGYQFCYVCGKFWDSHVCNTNSNRRYEQDVQDCLQYYSAEERCGLKWVFLLRIPFKIFAGIIITLLFLILAIKDVLVLLLAILLAFIAGPCVFSFQCVYKCCQQTKSYCLTFILIIFFPVCMIIGIKVAFKELSFPMVQTGLSWIPFSMTWYQRKIRYLTFI